MIAKNIQLNNQWADLNAELGVSKTEAIYVQNKSAGSVYLWPKDTAPPNNNSGIHLRIGEWTTINTEGESLYARGLGDVYIAVVSSTPSVSLEISEDTKLPVKYITTTSLNNSTQTNLSANQTFTGLADDVVDVGTILVSVFSSNISAPGGLKFQTSPNGTVWYDIDSYTYSNQTPYVYSLSPVFRYFRVAYTNGATETTSFFIQTFYKQGYVKPSSHRVGDIINGDNDAELTKAVLSAMKPNGEYTNIHATAGGNLKVSVEEFDEGVGRLPVEPLGSPIGAKKINVTTVSASVALTITCKRVSMVATGSSMRYVINTDGAAANATTSHYISQDERLDFSVPANAIVSAIRESASLANGVLEITELG